MRRRLVAATGTHVKVPDTAVFDVLVRIALSRAGDRTGGSVRGMAVGAEVHDVLDGFTDASLCQHGAEHEEQDEHALDHWLTLDRRRPVSSHRDERPGGAGRNDSIHLVEEVTAVEVGRQAEGHGASAG